MPGMRARVRSARPERRYAALPEVSDREPRAPALDVHDDLGRTQSRDGPQGTQEAAAEAQGGTKRRVPGRAERAPGTRAALNHEEFMNHKRTQRTQTPSCPSWFE